MSSVLTDSDNHSSEQIDIDALIKSAEQIDALADNPEVEAPKRGRRSRKSAPAPAAEDPKGAPIEPEVIPPMSPMFPAMVQGAVTCATDFMTLRKGWTDPGLKWKEDVGAALARIIHHYMPVGSENADLLIVGGYLSMYITANLMFPPKKVQP